MTALISIVCRSLRQIARHRIAAVSVIASAVGLPCWADQQATVEIDTELRYQTIQGFGASGAWWPNYVAELPDTDRDHLLRLLFTNKGADLSIYRCNLPAGDGPDIRSPLRRTVGIETSPGVYDFDRDWKSQRILKEIRNLGVERFVLFFNSPPPRMLVNGMVTGGPDGTSNLRADSRADFARYGLDVAEHYRKTFDLPVVTLSPINEPQWFWGKERRGHEGCHYTPEEVAATIAEFVREKNRRKSSIGIDAFESGSWKRTAEYAKVLFSIPEVDQEIKSLAVHSYWSNSAYRREFMEWLNKNHPGKTVAMTEYCQMKRTHGTGMDGALHMAKIMHQDLTICSVDSWQWWLAIHGGGYNDALIYVNPKTKKIEMTKRLWAIGNYSRFVRPGAVRIGCEAEGGILSSAYLDPSGKHIALVITNEGDKKTLRVNFKDQRRKLVEGYLTSPKDDLRKMDLKDADEVILPKRSLLTLLFVADPS